MSSGSPRGIARFDSAAAMAQAIGRFLHGRDVASLSGSAWFDRAMPLINCLPSRPREWVYSIGGMTEAVTAARVQGLDFGRIAEWLTALFPKRPYPAVFIGSSNGALMHLAAALAVPWLPQTFLCPVRNPFSDPDDVRASFAKGRVIAETVERTTPDVAVHHMHDPNQDRLMLKMMSYFRLKYTALPPAYRDFLIRYLPRGGAIYVDNCTKTWPVTRTSPRSVFQFGASGGLAPGEYLHASRRVADYLARYGARRTAWDPPEPNDVTCEAEWGFDPALLDDISALAAQHGWRLVVFEFDNPEALSWLAAAVYERWYRAMGDVPERLLVDSFVLLDPYRTIRLHALPFWLLFPVESSWSELRQFLDQARPFEEIGLFLFSHGTESAGLVEIGDWRRLLARARRRGHFLGVDAQRYPRDFATFTRFHRAVAELGLPCELPPPLTLQAFEAQLRDQGPRFGIEIAMNSRVTAASSLGAV